MPFWMPLPSLGIEPWAGIENGCCVGPNNFAFWSPPTECHGPHFLSTECAQLSGRIDLPGCRFCHMQIYLLISYLVSLQDSIQTRVILGLNGGWQLCAIFAWFSSPSLTDFLSSALHSLRTMCAYRQGIFTVGSASLDPSSFG